MVALILRLRLALLVGAVRGDRDKVTKTVVAVVFLAAATAVTCFAIASLANDSTDVARALLVLSGSALVLGVFIAPLIGAVEDQLDPRRFALFGFSPVGLAGTLLLAALVSVPTIALLIAGGFVVAVWMAQGVSAVVAVLSVVVALLTTLIAGRASMAIASLTLRQHRSRELSSLFALGLVVVVVPVVIFVASLDWGGTVPTQLEHVARILEFTPLGAAWAIPGAVAAGDAVAIALTVSIAIATLGGLVALWLYLVQHMLETVDKPLASADRAGLGWFAIAPGTAGGAIAARSVIYWLRDRRYIVNVAIVPITAVIAALPLLVAGVPGPTVALVPIFIMALFFGWIPHNDTAYDSTAVWMHVVSGVRGVADRLGRLVPILVVSVVMLAIAIPIGVSIFDRWAILPAVIGVAGSLLFTGLGLSSIASAVAPYAVTRPGDSPFQQPQRAGSGVASQGLVLVGAIVLSMPALWLGWLSLTDSIDHAGATMWVGLGTGFVVFVGGILIGAYAFDTRATKLMEFAETT